MAREKIVGFRVSDALHERLHEMAIERNTSISDVLRDILMDNLDMSYRYSHWEIHAWNLFNVNADQVKYAKSAAKIPEQFFSVLSKWSKDTKIRIIAHDQLVMIEFQRKDKIYVVQESKILPKIQIIQSIIDQLVEKIDKEVSDEAEGICDGSFRGELSPTSEEQLDESGISLSEGLGSEGHPSMSDTDDL
jgi:hypothetical protein